MSKKNQTEGILDLVELVSEMKTITSDDAKVYLTHSERIKNTKSRNELLNQIDHLKDMYKLERDETKKLKAYIKDQLDIDLDAFDG